MIQRTPYVGSVEQNSDLPFIDGVRIWIPYAENDGENSIKFYLRLFGYYFFM